MAILLNTIRFFEESALKSYIEYGRYCTNNKRPSTSQLAVAYTFPSRVMIRYSHSILMLRFVNYVSLIILFYIKSDKKGLIVKYSSFRLIKIDG